MIVKRSSIGLVIVALCAPAAACNSGSGAFGEGRAATLIKPGSDRVIAFTVQTGTKGKDMIYQAFVALPGGKAQRLTHGPDSAYAVAWTSDGSRLIILQRSLRYHHDRLSLYTVAIDGEPPVLLTRIPPGFDPSSADPLSPDGSLVLLSRGGGLSVENVHDGSLRQVATGVSGFITSTPAAWSPDGRRIVYAHILGTYSPGSVDITNYDGTGHTTIVHPDQLSGQWGNCSRSADANRGMPQRGGQCFYREVPGHVEWTTDGSRIIFDTTGGRLYSVKADGTELTRLAARGVGGSTDTVFSPDRTYVAYRANGNFVTRLDGTHATPLPGCGCGIGWSPDSTQLAVVEAGAVYIVNVDGSGLTQVTPSLARPIFNPIWRPNPQ